MIKCPHCQSLDLYKVDRPDIFEFDYKCNSCQRGFNNIQTKSRDGSQTFYKLLEEAAAIHDRKSHDYATNNDPLVNYRTAGIVSKLFKDPTDAGLAGRAAEKVMRLIALDDKEPLNESIEDTENDLLVIVGLFVANRIDRRVKNKSNKESDKEPRRPAGWGMTGGFVP